MQEMAKTKSAEKNVASLSAKQSLKGIKNGSVKKNKNSNFKSTPMGKITLINDTKVGAPQKNIQKNAGTKGNQRSPKNAERLIERKNSPKGKQNFPKGKQNSPNGPRNQQTKKKFQLSKEELEDDFNFDINKKIALQKDSLTMDEMVEDEESDTPDIFGTSLADDSDEDDEDFESEEEEGEEEEAEEEEEEEEDTSDEEIVEYKGIKMFKGIKSNTKNQEMEEKDDDDDEDDDEDEDEDDDDDEDEDDEDENIENTDMSKLNTSSSGIEDDEDDEDEDDEDEDEDDENEDDEDEDDEIEDATDENSGLGLKALLGKTITDDEDDEDFDEEEEDDEDDDISDENKDEDENEERAVESKKGKSAKVSNVKNVSRDEEIKKKPSPKEQEEIDKKTIFIDNIAKETKQAAMRKVFGQFGPINSIRFRSILPRNAKIPKKVAAITDDIHPKATTVTAYIYYKSQESAKKAVLNMNGKVFQRNYINVKIVGEKKKYDTKKAVFLGNLRIGGDINAIWKRFGECGEIDSVHLLRDHKTGKTKGFGYVNFKSEDAATLALKLDGIEIAQRSVRVRPYIIKGNKKAEKRAHSSEANQPSKKFKDNSQKVVARPTQSTPDIKKQQKQLQKENNKSSERKNDSTSFEGQKAHLKNKKKKDKFNKKKKIIADKFAAKPKKVKV